MKKPCRPRDRWIERKDGETIDIFEIILMLRQ